MTKMIYFKGLKNLMFCNHLSSELVYKLVNFLYEKNKRVENIRCHVTYIYYCIYI